MGEWVGSLAGASEGKRSGVCKWAGWVFTRLRLIFCRKVTSKVCLGMGGFIHGCRNCK